MLEKLFCKHEMYEFLRRETDVLLVYQCKKCKKLTKVSLGQVILEYKKCVTELNPVHFDKNDYMALIIKHGDGETFDMLGPAVEKVIKTYRAQGVDLGEADGVTLTTRTKNVASKFRQQLKDIADSKYEQEYVNIYVVEPTGVLSEYMTHLSGGMFVTDGDSPKVICSKKELNVKSETMRFCTDNAEYAYTALEFMRMEGKSLLTEASKEWLNKNKVSLSVIQPLLKMFNVDVNEFVAEYGKSYLDGNLTTNY